MAVPEFFSNGTYGAGGTSTLSSIAPLMGFKLNDDGTICAVPEQIPDNWYRRATPWGIANVVANAPGTLLAGNTLPSPLSSVIAKGDANEIGCELYQLLSSQSPASLGVPLVDGVSSLLTGLQNQLLGGLPVRSIRVFFFWFPGPLQIHFHAQADTTATRTHAHTDPLWLLRRRKLDRRAARVRRLAAGSRSGRQPNLGLRLKPPSPLSGYSAC